MWLSKSIFFVDLLFTDKKKQKTKQNVILVLYSYYVGGKLKMVYFMIAVEHFNHTDKRLKLGSDDRIHKTTICILTDGKDNAS